MIPHPRTMQVVNDQRWQELHARIARERRGMNASLASGNREMAHCLTRSDVAAFVAACSGALGSVTFVLRATPRTSR